MSTYCTSISVHEKVRVKIRHLNYSGVDDTIGEADKSTFTDQVGPRQSYNTLNMDISLVFFLKYTLK